VDQEVFDEVFLSGEFDIDFGAPSFILDAGAHIGLSSVYFANRFPNAIVLAIEPDASNYNILCKNALAYPNIKPIQGGLWGHTGKLSIASKDAES
tara:strand:+ start:168 stop:452 length:285 start_codon:yes stop_codon:yes gene_type:complete